MTTLNGDVFADEENNTTQAAFAQQSFQAAVRIAQSAPMDLPSDLINNLDEVESGADVLQVLQSFERALHETALLAVTPESNHQVMRSATSLAKSILEAFCLLDQGCQASALGFTRPGSFLSIADWLRHF